MGLTAFNRRRRKRRLAGRHAASATTTQRSAPTPVHVGGGWYEVSGERYQGREAAERRARQLVEG